MSKKWLLHTCKPNIIRLQIDWNTKTIGIIAFIADTLWLSPPYHEKAYHGKIWPIVILIEHRHVFGALIFATLLEQSGIELIREQGHNCPGSNKDNGRQIFGRPLL